MSPSSQREFIVAGVVAGRDNLLSGPYRSIIVRCGDLPIDKGTVFLSIYRYDYPNGLGEEPVRDVVTPVRVEVVEIQTLNRSFDQLGQGMTGMLIVRGDGLDLLQHGWVVGDPVPTPRQEGTSPQSPESALAETGSPAKGAGG